MRGVAGEIHALHARVRREPGRHFAGVRALPLHAQRQGLDAAHGQIAFKRAHHRTQCARKRLDRDQNAPHRRRPRRPARRHDRPDTWSRCGPRFPRPARAAASAAASRKCCPRSAARPARLPIAAILSIAPTRSRGFEIVSMTIAPGFVSATACSTAARSQMSTNVVSMPSGPKMFISMLVVAP